MLVAVYGTLRQGMSNHFYLKDSKFKGFVKVSNRYSMFDLGNFPAIIKGGKQPIIVEIYEISGKTFESLDRLEGHPNLYKREQVNTPFGEAWVYYMEKIRGGHPVPHGDWCRHKNGRNIKESVKGLN